MEIKSTRVDSESCANVKEKSEASSNVNKGRCIKKEHRNVNERDININYQIDERDILSKNNITNGKYMIEE